MRQAHQEILRLISTQNLKVGVIGMGHVGLPLALTFVERAQVKVIGFDIDASKIDALQRGETYIMHIGERRVRLARESSLFDATSDFSRLREPDALLIAVPTPLTPQREPDLQYVVQTAQAIRDRLRPGQLVVLESTTYPGTTDELLKNILEQSGLKCGQDFLLAFSPEREDPGNRHFNTASIPKVVGGVDDDAAEVAVAMYEMAFEQVVRVKSARVAEATKLTENIFRSVNVALVNELKTVFDRMNIDIWEVLDAAATKPFGFMKFSPGPGLGGHCIPLDPFYLAWKAREFGIITRLVELAGEVNLSMPKYVIDKLQAALNDRAKALRGSHILVLGLAYKKDIDDTRESPSFALISLLLDRGAIVSYHDPHIAIAPPMRSWPKMPPMRSVALTAGYVQSVDAILIATDHSGVDYELIVSNAQLIVDSRGVYREARDNVVKA
jgi:UDP-N-acetyl-D-glucosamine dehydrogenase